MPQDGATTRLAGGLAALARSARGLLVWLAPVSPRVRTLTVLAAAVALVAAVAYYGADTFSRRAVDQRAATEAGSLAAVTAHLATGDAFNTYMEMLRYAEDPRVHQRATPRDVRTGVMRQDLYLNTNNLASLIVADRSGTVLASTDPSVTRVLDSPAFQQARSTLTPSSSDVVLPQAGRPGYVEFAVPLKDGDGTTWGMLLGRADPARLWKATLGAQVDGSRNVVINASGVYAAGVPDALLGQPWRGQPLAGGGVRAVVAGVDSICGLSPIGKGSQIDQGSTLASCLPSSLVEAEHAQAMGKQGWVTVAGAVLAVVMGGVALSFGDRRRRPLLLLAGPREDAAPEPEEPAPAAAAAPVAATVLIEAYERRNERLSEQLRDDVRARLLLAGAQADEAYRRIDPESAAEDAPYAPSGLHAQAMAELEAVRDRELRAIEQELYPGIVRLGLPNALKALRKELEPVIDLTLEMDPLADAVDEASDRAAIDVGRRLVLYRFVLEGARALAEAGAREAFVTLGRGEAAVTLAIGAPLDETDDAAAAALDARFETSRLAIEAYGGALDRARDGAQYRAVATFPA
ncbi:MAG: cache domain-containing protein [Chloroflexota bacterium]|nr:cache domain-containing protein [Chloroflexota bacterium]